jgi:hypothetical protein
MTTETKITGAAAYSRLKHVIADIKNIPVSAIRAAMTLREDLGFTEAGVRALATPINQAFVDTGASITRDEATQADTVRDLYVLIWSKIPEARKES